MQIKSLPSFSTGNSQSLLSVQRTKNDHEQVEQKVHSGMKYKSGTFKKKWKSEHGLLECDAV
jgi:hypothetical protein